MFWQVSWDSTAEAPGEDFFSRDGGTAQGVSSGRDAACVANDGKVKPCPTSQPCLCHSHPRPPTHLCTWAAGEVAGTRMTQDQIGGAGDSMPPPWNRQVRAEGDSELRSALCVPVLLTSEGLK